MPKTKEPIGVMEDGTGTLTNHAGTRTKPLRFKTVHAFAFNTSAKQVVAYVAAYKTTDKAITNFIAKYSGWCSVGVFTGKSEWY